MDDCARLLQGIQPELTTVADFARVELKDAPEGSAILWELCLTNSSDDESTRSETGTKHVQD